MKIFREHRGSLVESLKTTIECPNGLQDIIEHFKNTPWTNFRINPDFIKDNRLPEEWNGGIYYVTCDYNEKTNCCIGMCNFIEV